LSEDKFPGLQRKSVRRHEVIQVIALPKHYRLVSAAEARHRLHQRVEDRLEVDGRAVDDLEHVAGGSLLLQRSLEIARARPHFVKQSDIADGDYSLIGERLQQGDLFVAERLHFSAAQHDRADTLSFAK
jgi:hypothetical protein